MRLATPPKNTYATAPDTMTLDVQRLFSIVAGRLRASEIRELLKLLDRPEMISFAGGLPNPAAFPLGALSEIVTHVMQDMDQKRYNMVQPRGTFD